MKAITARQVATVRRGRHRVAGTPGLFVLVHASGARSWVYRGWNGTQEIARGLGSVIDVSLTDARNAAIRLRAGIIDGTDDLPRSRSRATVRAAVHTWEDVFSRLRERKTGSVRASTLRGIDSTWRQHVQPVLGARDVTATTREDVIDLIAGREGSAALKVRKLTREIGALAVSLGWLSASPAGPEIDTALPTTAKRASDGRRRAMPHAMIGEWLRSLTAGPVGDAIRTLALTAARVADVLDAEWSEVDLDGAVWTIPGARHKSSKDFRIPLTAPVLAILERQRGRDARFVFPSTRIAGKAISAQHVRKTAMHAEYDLHGFRSGFRTWAAESGQDRAVTETCLAHAVGSSIERAYQRSDLMDRRRAVLNEWAAYITQPAS